MTERTPGPWAAPKIWAYQYICPADHVNRPVGASVDPTINRDRYMQIIATVGDDEFDRGDRQANARLIAAAPDLLEALQRAVTELKIAQNIYEQSGEAVLAGMAAVAVQIGAETIAKAESND